MTPGKKMTLAFGVLSVVHLAAFTGGYVRASQIGYTASEMIGAVICMLVPGLVFAWAAFSWRSRWPRIAAWTAIVFLSYGLLGAFPIIAAAGGSLVKEPAFIGAVAIELIFLACGAAALIRTRGSVSERE